MYNIPCCRLAVDAIIRNQMNIWHVLRAITNLKIGFVFTGQGAQWVNMGKELLAFPTFERSIIEEGVFLKKLGSNWKVRGKF